MESLFNSKFLSDAILHIFDERNEVFLDIHKAILVLNSDYFLTFFSSEINRNITNERQIIHLNLIINYELNDQLGTIEETIQIIKFLYQLTKEPQDEKEIINPDNLNHRMLDYFGVSNVLVLDLDLFKNIEFVFRSDNVFLGMLHYSKNGEEKIIPDFIFMKIKINLTKRLEIIMDLNKADDEFNDNFKKLLKYLDSEENLNKFDEPLESYMFKNVGPKKYRIGKILSEKLIDFIKINSLTSDLAKEQIDKVIFKQTVLNLIKGKQGMSRGRISSTGVFPFHTSINRGIFSSGFIGAAEAAATASSTARDFTESTLDDDVELD